MCRATFHGVRRLAAALLAGLLATVRSAVAAPPEASTAGDGWFYLDAGWHEGLTYEYRQRIPAVSDLGGLIRSRPEQGQESTERAAPHEPFHVKGRIGGSLYLDGGRLRGSAVEDGLDGAVRRARAYTRGEFGYRLTTEYKFEFALENDRFFLNDFYLRWRPERWVDTVRFGYFDPPVSPQALASSNGRSLMEVAAPVAAFAPGFRLGLEAAGLVADPSLTWSFDLSSVGQAQSIGNASSDPLRVVGRLVWRPWGPEREDAPLLHVGTSAAWAFSGGGSIQHRARPESFLAPFLVDTGNIEGNATLVGGEAIWRDGPTSLQGEVLYSFVRGKGSRVYHFWGTYLQASWVVTGESRSYDSRTAVLGRTRPKASFAPLRGAWGAVELAGRVSWVDLSHGAIEGGRMLTATVGPTWTLNRWVRLLGGLVFARVRDGTRDGDARIAQLRLELVL
jgi:phosphate-selective porin OprO/OprP